MDRYIPRVVDNQLQFALESTGAVWIKGPKFCGKSTTAMQFSKTVIKMQDEDEKEQNIMLARIKPSIFLKGETPLLIDEWQVIPFIWNQIRMEVDKRNEFGQFIITGSTLPNEDPDRHSGIGRFSDILMRPMSLFESGESDGSVSLSSLIQGVGFESCRCKMSLEDYAYVTARGGWPSAMGKSRRIALRQAKTFYEGLVNSDISLSDGIKRDPDRVKLLIASLARNCSTQANISVIRNDMLANDDSTLSENTVSSYIKALKNLFVIEDSKCWSPNLRSKTAIRTSDTRYFVDPSIACAGLDVGPEGLIKNLKTFGLLFENLCIRDIRVYLGGMDCTVKHYRDASGFEIDAILAFQNGTWAGVEVKLGASDFIEKGAADLIKLSEKVGENVGKPLFLMVLTTSGIAYQREDGVYVVPLGCLGP